MYLPEIDLPFLNQICFFAVECSIRRWTLNHLLAETVGLLNRTPRVLNALLRDNGQMGYAESGRAVGQLLVIEEAVWIPAVTSILRSGDWPAMDRECAATSPDLPINKLLDQFGMARRRNLRSLQEFRLAAGDLATEGIHPAAGRVSIDQILRAWVACDLRFVRTIADEMAERYPEREEWLFVREEKEM